MFGRKAESVNGRYYVEFVGGALRTGVRQAAEVQKRLNDGDASGWKLLNVTSYGNPGQGEVLLFWDTRLD